MKEKLVVGIIADTSHPAAVERLLADLVEVVRRDEHLATMDVVVLENPSGPEQHPLRFDGSGRITLQCIDRPTQVADAQRGLFGHVKLGSERLPISIARTLVQRYVYLRTQTVRACAWILDEDLRLHPLLAAMDASPCGLSEQITRWRDERIDVAIAPVLGAPPLPARSSLRVNLEDVLRHLREFDERGPLALWPDRSVDNAAIRRQFPEYYYDLTMAHEDPGRLSYWMDPQHESETVESVFGRMAVALRGLVGGIPVTRILPSDDECVLPSIGLARGGNTLLLEPRLLGLIPNVVPEFDGRACRRSDMVWARLAAQFEGAHFARVSLPVWQDRTGQENSALDPMKLIDDLRGSALVRTMDTIISEGMLPIAAPLAASAASRAAEVFREILTKRLNAIGRSEERVHHLLDEIDRYLSTNLTAPAFKSACKSLQEGVLALRRAMGNTGIFVNVPADSLAVEKFFLELHTHVDAYRRVQDERPDRCPAVTRTHVRLIDR